MWIAVLFYFKAKEFRLHFENSGTSIKHWWQCEFLGSSNRKNYHRYKATWIIRTKRGRPRFSFCMWLVERVARVFLDQSQSGVKQTQCDLRLLVTLILKLLRHDYNLNAGFREHGKFHSEPDKLLNGNRRKKKTDILRKGTNYDFW